MLRVIRDAVEDVGLRAFGRLLGRVGGYLRFYRCLLGSCGGLQSESGDGRTALVEI